MVKRQKNLYLHIYVKKVVRFLVVSAPSIHEVHDVEENELILSQDIRVEKIDDSLQKVPVIFIYEKNDRAIYLSHINVMRIFEQTFQRAGIQVAFTQGV